MKSEKTTIKITVKNLNFCVVCGYKDFSLAIAVDISHNRRQQTFALELNQVLIGEMHPRLMEGEITLMLKQTKKKNKIG